MYKIPKGMICLNTKLEMLENIKENHKGKVKKITMIWANP